jgi:ATP-dependent Lhr-like helicase
MDDSGRLRRGYFVAGLGATQFALPGALDLLRSMRDPKGDDRPDVVAISATDPANPYGAVLPWPTPTQARPDTPGRGPTRSVGATVILVDGRLGAYLARGDRLLVTWLPDAEPERSRVARAVAQTLIERARSGGDAPRGMLIEDIDGAPPDTHALAPFLTAVGFAGGAMGFQATFRRAAPPARELAGTFSDA